MIFSRDNNMTLLLITGKAGTGKTTMSEYIVEHYEGSKNYALGDKLKELTFRLLKIFGVEIESLNDLYDVKTKNKYRHYMQQIGTDCVREVFGEDFWCEVLSERVLHDLCEERTVMISDVRFRNEIKYFRTLCERGRFSCYVLNVIRSNNEISLSEPEKKHISECDLVCENYDFEIYNNYDINHLYEQIDVVMRSLRHENEQEAQEPTVDDSAQEPTVERESQDSTVDDITQEQPVDVIPQELTVERASQESPVDIITQELTVERESREQPIDVIPQHSHLDVITQEPTVDVITQLSYLNKHSKPSPPTFATPTLTGQHGEALVFSLLSKVRPEFQIDKVGHIPHLGDIHCIDHNNNILYLIEVKLKHNITRQDVDKFISDIQNVKTMHSTESLRVIGIFLSLSSDSIPGIGHFSISKDQIYLTSKFINKWTLKLLFSFTEICSTDSYNQSVKSPESHAYELPPNVIALIIKLREEYASINRDIELCQNIKHNSEQNLLHIQELISKSITKMEVVKFLSNVFAFVSSDVSSYVIENDEAKLIEYIKNTPKTNIRRSYLLKTFPTLRHLITSMKLSELITKYK